MTEKFTPGPWKATYDSQLQAAIEIYNTEDRVMVAGLPDRGTIEAMSEIEANATLIAAAPEMFEALKSASIALNMVRGSTFCETCDDNEICETCGIYKAQLQTDAVLKKARGEE